MEHKNTLSTEADWRQVATGQPWLSAQWAVVGQSGGKGSTRSRWTVYEIHHDGRLVATRSMLREAKAYADEKAGYPLEWMQHILEATPVNTVLYGETTEFSGPTRWHEGLGPDSY